MSLHIEKSGLQATIQDLGRFGHQKEGIIVSGPMDRVALRMANLLVGNPEHAAVIETVAPGPAIRFQKDTLIALTGADLSPAIAGVPVKMNRPVLVRQHALLEFGAPRAGVYTYLAVAGSFDLPQVLGSLATYLRAGIGGFGGRALQTGDVLPLGQAPAGFTSLLRTVPETAAFTPATWTPDHSLFPVHQEQPKLRAVRGPEYDLLTSNSKGYLWSEKYQITRQADRMGYHLYGTPLAMAAPAELISSAVTFGTIQVPSEGNPIVLMADHQTTGGYPRIAQVITADLTHLAQTGPGKLITFEEVTLQEAQQHYLQQELNLEIMKKGIELKRLFT
ncbi:biotin-dependent carboxyltransferase family protein [Pontibacter qinzhouensis]|uniref:Biotin-dependent carboxyltransferase family protein n=1 Tax=Pontibacter qinzhouensis TaxID=2603253 RepID=A0A5C8KC81_9BACT|nr:biotin-dependent carboxyltransferase family protein [Pontibacter qinzhouensis]TXK48028.1 biotin-dependent carboxyltransferase family protein [Pontibacter qinzhouensis]